MIIIVTGHLRHQPARNLCWAQAQAAVGRSLIAQQRGLQVLHPCASAIRDMGAISIVTAMGLAASSFEGREAAGGAGEKAEQAKFPANPFLLIWRSASGDRFALPIPKIGG